MEDGEVAERERQSSALSLETMELQWESYVINLKASGTLSSALAVCETCVALHAWGTNGGEMM